MAGKKLSAVYVSWPKPNFATVVSTNKHFRTNFHMALTYAHYELTANQLKKEVQVYLKSTDTKNTLLDRIKDIDENRFTTIGKYMYVLNHGGEIPEDILKGVMPALERMIDEEEAKSISENQKEDKKKAENCPQVSENTGRVITIQTRLRDAAREVAGEVEGWLDDFCMDKKTSVKTVDEFVALFRANDLKAPHMRHVQEIFARRAQEVADAVEARDKDLTEAYSNFTKPELKKFDLFHKNILKACVMMQEVAKVERAPRKKKPVSTEKVVAKLKFKKDDSSLGIVSLNPVQIVGSKELWVYNTKTRKLSQYKAIDERGLSVKGTGLLNYSTDSVEKTIRKPAETLTDFKKASKVKLRTFLKDLSTLDVPANGKLNEHCVLLRIDK
jgi:hypothetical protein